MNLGKTASVKSVTTDTKILDAKKVETAELLVDGVSISEVVPKWKPREHIYRCVLEEDDDYIIYDDEGNFLDCKLDKLENGSSLFQYTKGVENFSFSLPSLTNGSNMFDNCNLGKKAVESILRTIPEYSEGSHPLTMNLNTSAIDIFNRITGNLSETSGIVSYKGWGISTNAKFALPDGYSYLYFLEGTGTQWIDTGLPTNNDTRIVALARLTASYDGTTQYHRLFGSTHSTDNRLTMTLTMYENGLSIASRFGGTSSSFGTGVTNDSLAKCDYEYVISNSKVGITGVRVAEREVADSWTNSSSCCLFTWGSAFYSHARIYRFQMSERDALKLKFIPVLDEQGIPCMFDVVSRKSFYNSGTGQFVAGIGTLADARNFALPATGGTLALSLPYEAERDTESQTALERARTNGWTLTVLYREPELPVGYKRVEYIEGTGETYLTIPREWKQDDSLRMEYISTQESPNENLFGAGNNYRAVNTYSYTRWRLAGQYYDFAKAVPGEKNVITYDPLKVTANGKEKALTTTTWDNTKTSYNIFTNDTLDYKGQFRLLYFEHLSAADLKLVPALSETGAPCMYDLVEGKSYYNEGSNDFTYPTETTTYSLRQPVPTYAKMTAHGVQKLYHLPEGYEGSEDEYAQENRFKLLTENERPEEGSWRHEWVETDNELILNWIEVEEEMTDV